MPVSYKNKLFTLALVLLVALFAVISAWLDRRAAEETAASPDLPVYSVELPEGEKKAALTFDAAWGNEDTKDLIAILERYGVKATFFVIGKWAEKYPDSVRELAEAGHDVMNHSWDHPHFTALSGPEMVKNRFWIPVMGCVSVQSSSTHSPLVGSMFSFPLAVPDLLPVRMVSVTLPSDLTRALNDWAPASPKSTLSTLI